MAKKSSAERPVPSPQGAQGAQGVADALNSVREARERVQESQLALASAVLEGGAESISALRNSELREVLRELVASRRFEAVIALVSAAGIDWNKGHELGEEVAAAFLHIAVNRDVSVFAEEGKLKPIGELLVEAIRAAHHASANMGDAILKIVRTGTQTDSIVAQAMRADLHIIDKVRVLELAHDLTGFPRQSYEQMVEQLLRLASEREADVPKVLKKMMEVAKALDEFGLAESGLVRKVVSHADCRAAADVAAAVPETFEAAKDAVLKSGSPEALATFWRKHSTRCDKEAFQQRLTDALRPDPEAMARAILDGDRDRMFGFPYRPMMGPMMMGPILFMGRRPLY